MEGNKSAQGNNYDNIKLTLLSSVSLYYGMRWALLIFALNAYRKYNTVTPSLAIIFSLSWIFCGFYFTLFSSLIALLYNGIYHKEPLNTLYTNILEDIKPLKKCQETVNTVNNKINDVGNQTNKYVEKYGINNIFQKINDYIGTLITKCDNMIQGIPKIGEFIHFLIHFIYDFIYKVLLITDNKDNKDNKINIDNKKPVYYQMPELKEVPLPVLHELPKGLNKGLPKGLDNGLPVDFSDLMKPPTEEELKVMQQMMGMFSQMANNTNIKKSQ